MGEKLIVFDLNGVLLSRLYVKDRIPIYENYVRINNHAVWLRPGLKEFLEKMSKEYTLAIWSSISRWNLEQLLNTYDKELLKDDMLFIWSQRECWRVFETIITRLASVSAV